MKGINRVNMTLKSKPVRGFTAVIVAVACAVVGFTGTVLAATPSADCTNAAKEMPWNGELPATLTPGVTYCKPVTAAQQIQAGTNQSGGTNNTTDLNAFIKTIINTLLFVIGAVAVIMIIIGGIRYVTSNGEQAHVKGAKDTILYAVVGLVVAILAYAIVNFVVMNVK